MESFIIVAGILVILVVLAAVFRKMHILLLILGTASVAFGIYRLMYAMDHIKGFLNQMGNLFDNDRYEAYLSMRIQGIIFITVGAVLLITGFIFAIKSGNREKEKTVSADNGYRNPADYKMACRNCGRRIPAGTKFCPECGTSQQEPAKRTCPECGAQVKEKDRFCENCGKKLS